MWVAFLQEYAIAVKLAAVTTDTTRRVGGYVNTTAVDWTGRTAEINAF